MASSESKKQLNDIAEFNNNDFSNLDALFRPPVNKK